MSRKPFPYAPRAVRLVLCAAYFSCQVVGARGEETRFWSERKAAAGRLSGRSPSGVIDLAQLPSAARLDFSAAASPAGARVPVDMPQSAPRDLAWLAGLVQPHGSLLDAHLSKKPGAPLVIHLQDAHEIEEAQRNAAAILQNLQREKNIQLIGLEGASGPFALEAYRAYPRPDVTRALADHFLKRGYIGGAEYMGLTAPRSPLLWGVEDPAAYDANVHAVRESRGQRPAADAFLAATRAALDRLKEKTASPALLEFDRRALAYRTRAAGLGERVRYLADIAPAALASAPNLGLFLQALVWEETADFQRVEEDRRRLVERLIQALPPRQLDLLAQDGLRCRRGELSHGEYHRSLLNACRKAGLRPRDFSRFDAYVRYVLLAERIERNQLLEELDRLETAAQDALARTPEQKRLVSLQRRLALAEKLVAHAMTPRDFAAYLAQKSEIVGLARELSLSVDGGAALLAPFESFCAHALRRNAALVDNLLTRMTSDHAPAAVLVAGGFHTEGLTRLLRARGASYAVVTPRIGRLPDRHDPLGAFAREARPLEKLFSGDLVSLKYPPSLANSSNTPESRSVAALHHTAHIIVERALGRRLTDQESDHLAEALPHLDAVKASTRREGAYVLDSFELVSDGQDVNVDVLFTTREKWALARASLNLRTMDVVDLPIKETPYIMVVLRSRSALPDSHSALMDDLRTALKLTAWTVAWREAFQFFNPLRPVTRNPITFYQRHQFQSLREKVSGAFGVLSMVASSSAMAYGFLRFLSISPASDILALGIFISVFALAWVASIPVHGLYLKFAIPRGWGLLTLPNGGTPPSASLEKLRMLLERDFDSRPGTAAARFLSFSTKAQFLLRYRLLGPLRLGFFGKNRPEASRRLNAWFGAGEWRLEGRAGDRRLDESAVLRLYEDAYVDYFENNPTVLNDLLELAQDVYDTAPSNVHSGLNYHAQEAPELGAHIHDVAIRRAVHRLGRTFSGRELIQIRGQKNRHLSPGSVPFHRPELIPHSLRGWWEPRTIEDFYQSCRIFTIAKQDDQSSQRPFDPPSLAVSLFEKYSPFIMDGKVILSDLYRVIWRLEDEDFPRDDEGRPRPFTPMEIFNVLIEFMSLFQEVSALTNNRPMRQSVENAQAWLLSLINPSALRMDEDVARGWAEVAHQAHDILQSMETIPVYIARDTLPLHEYGRYADSLGARAPPSFVVYQAGIPSPHQGTLNRRSAAPSFQQTVQRISDLFQEVKGELVAEGIIAGDPRTPPVPDSREEVFSELKNRFYRKITDTIRSDPEFSSYAENVYKDLLKQGFPAGRPVTVMDSLGTGKSALFVSAVIQYFSAAYGSPVEVGVLMGWAIERNLGIPDTGHFTPTIPSDAFHDLVWPFTYDGRDALSDDPVFKARNGVQEYLLLAFRSMLLYNAAAQRQKKYQQPFRLRRLKARVGGGHFRRPEKTLATKQQIGATAGKYPDYEPRALERLVRRYGADQGEVEAAISVARNTGTVLGYVLDLAYWADVAPRYVEEAVKIGTAHGISPETVLQQARRIEEALPSLGMSAALDDVRKLLDIPRPASAGTAADSRELGSQTLPRLVDLLIAGGGHHSFVRFVADTLSSLAVKNVNPAFYEIASFRREIHPDVWREDVFHEAVVGLVEVLRPLHARVSLMKRRAMVRRHLKATFAELENRSAGALHGNAAVAGEVLFPLLREIRRRMEVTDFKGANGLAVRALIGALSNLGVDLAVEEEALEQALAGTNWGGQAWGVVVTAMTVLGFRPGTEKISYSEIERLKSEVRHRLNVSMEMTLDNRAPGEEVPDLDLRKLFVVDRDPRFAHVLKIRASAAAWNALRDWQKVVALAHEYLEFKGFSHDTVERWGFTLNEGGLSPDLDSDESLLNFTERVLGLAAAYAKSPPSAQPIEKEMPAAAADAPQSAPRRKASAASRKKRQGRRARALSRPRKESKSNQPREYRGWKKKFKATDSEMEEAQAIAARMGSSVPYILFLARGADVPVRQGEKAIEIANEYGLLADVVLRESNRIAAALPSQDVSAAMDSLADVLAIPRPFLRRKIDTGLLPFTSGVLPRLVDLLIAGGGDVSFVRSVVHALEPLAGDLDSIHIVLEEAAALLRGRSSSATPDQQALRAAVAGFVAAKPTRNNIARRKAVAQAHLEQAFAATSGALYGEAVVLNKVVLPLLREVRRRAAAGDIYGIDRDALLALSVICLRRLGFDLAAGEEDFAGAVRAASWRGSFMIVAQAALAALNLNPGPRTPSSVTVRRFIIALRTMFGVELKLVIDRRDPGLLPGLELDRLLTFHRDPRRPSVLTVHASAAAWKSLNDDEKIVALAHEFLESRGVSCDDATAWGFETGEGGLRRLPREKTSSFLRRVLGLAAFYSGIAYAETGDERTRMASALDRLNGLFGDDWSNGAALLWVDKWEKEIEFLLQGSDETVVIPAGTARRLLFMKSLGEQMIDFLKDPESADEDDMGNMLDDLVDLPEDYEALQELLDSLAERPAEEREHLAALLQDRVESNEQIESGYQVKSMAGLARWDLLHRLRRADGALPVRFRLFTEVYTDQPVVEGFLSLNGRENLWPLSDGSGLWVELDVPVLAMGPSHWMERRAGLFPTFTGWGPARVLAVRMIQSRTAPPGEPLRLTPIPAASKRLDSMELLLPPLTSVERLSRVYDELAEAENLAVRAAQAARERSSTDSDLLFQGLALAAPLPLREFQEDFDSTLEHTIRQNTGHAGNLRWALSAQANGYLQKMLKDIRDAADSAAKAYSAEDVRQLYSQLALLHMLDERSILSVLLERIPAQLGTAFAVRPNKAAEMQALHEEGLEAFHAMEIAAFKLEGAAKRFEEELSGNPAKAVALEASAAMLLPSADPLTGSERTAFALLRVLARRLAEGGPTPRVVIPVPHFENKLKILPNAAFELLISRALVEKVLSKDEASALRRARAENRLSMVLAQFENGLVNESGQIIKKKLEEHAGAGPFSAVFALDQRHWDVQDVLVLLGMGLLSDAAEAVHQDLRRLVLIRGNA